MSDMPPGFLNTALGTVDIALP